MVVGGWSSGSWREEHGGGAVNPGDDPKASVCPVGG